MLNCRNCGAQLPSGAKYCPDCGAPVPCQTPQQTDNTPSPVSPSLPLPKRKSLTRQWWFWVIVVIAAFLFIRNRVIIPSHRARSNAAASLSATTPVPVTPTPETVRLVPADTPSPSPTKRPAPTPIPMPTPSPHPTAKPTPTPSADPDISTRNEEISYTLCTLGDYEFSIPDYYGEAVESSESKAVYQLDMGNNNIRVLEIDSGSIETPPTALSFNLGCNWQFTQWHNENSKKYSNYSQGENSIFSHDNLLYGATFGVVGYSDGAVILIMSIISSPDSNNVIAMIWSVITSDQENIVSDITSEYLYILNSIILTSSKSTPSSISPSPIPSPKPTPAPTPSPSPAPAGIRPEVKELLDNYEAVMDEYIAFMEKYLDADSENMLGMLSDYYRILNEYSEMLEKINALDTDELNSEELAYYLEVTSRVTQKLLKASS